MHTIEETIAQAEMHQNDTDEFVALHTADAILVNIAGRRVLGRPDIERAMRAALATPLAKVRTRIEIVDTRFAHPDVAIVSCIKHVSDERDDRDTGLPTRGALTYVLVREADGWRIAAAQTTPIN